MIQTIESIKKINPKLPFTSVFGEVLISGTCIPNIFAKNVACTLNEIYARKLQRNIIPTKRRDPINFKKVPSDIGSVGFFGGGVDVLGVGVAVLCSWVPAGLFSISFIQA